MEGNLLGRAIVILIDTGASHNFIATSLVKELGLTVIPTKQFGVMVGDGHEVKGMGLCKAVELEVQGFHLTINCLPFELGRVDVILGCDWLRTLGKFSINLNSSLLSFRWGNEKVVLRGSSALATTKVSMKSFLCTVKTNGGNCWVLLNVLEGSPIVDSLQCPEELKPVLDEFKGVFEVPTGLPPHRPQDHAIQLRLGAQPPNIRPYRCPHSQKNKIERIVKDMLTAGIIKPRTSRFLVQYY